jgi:LacI family transcriptional regulator
MQRLANHVIELGHHKIAVISGVTNGNDRAMQRLEGIRDALREHGLDAEDLKIIETPYDVQNGEDAFDELMLADVRPSVVMCGNDVLAVGAQRRAQEIGLRVPEDISITGFDDIELARIMVPALTTVHVPHREMGRKAAIELVNIVEKNSVGASLELNAPIEIRGTLGKPRT